MKKQTDEDVTNLIFHKIGQSEISIWHRPSKDHIKALKKIGLTLLVTCQGPKEMPEDLTKICTPL